MALGDYAKHLEILAQLSREHEFTWKLFVRFSPMDEADIGFIENGEISESAIRHMTQVMDGYRLSHEDLLNEDRRRAIFSKYADENGENSPDSK